MIPKIIHQIWIGPNKIPDKIQSYCDGVKEKFNDYEYMFWNNDNLPNLPKRCKLQMKRYGGKNKPALQADILRYYVLNKHGGIYIDADFICYESFGHIIKKPFFCVSPNTMAYWACNGLFGCEPNNPILNMLLLELGREPTHGPQLLTRYILQYLGFGDRTNLYAYLESNPHDYIQCEKPNKFFRKGGEYCYHDALRSWQPKRKAKS